jgi:protein-tyrosine phosphatase
VTDQTLSVLFVCLGNICRSPLAEALFRNVVVEAGLEDRFVIDSAGTSGYHDGEPPDRRTTAVAAKRGVKVDGTSRQITGTDVDSFDYLIVMDAENLRNVERLARNARGTPEVWLLREFDPDPGGDLNVPDPYFGGADGFENVHEIVERSARGLLTYIRQQHDL